MKIDVCAIGYTNLPEFTYSFNLGFAYKGFDLDANFQGVGNRTVYRSGRYYEAFRNNGNASEWALERWTPATAATATYPRLSTGETRTTIRHHRSGRKTVHSSNSAVSKWDTRFPFSL